MERSTSKNYILVATIVLFYVVLYAIQVHTDKSITDINLIYRRIETPGKLLLNGYLGHFFNFKYLGNLNWLLIPFGLFAVFKLRYFDEPWKKAVAFAYLLSLLLISAKGYFNSRYQLTLLPITLPSALFFLWLYLKENNLLFYKFRIFSFLLLLTLANNAVGFVFLKTITLPSSNIESKGIIYSIKHPIETFNRLQHKKKTTPYPAVDFIRSLPKNENVLVNNLPMLYYYTSKHGTYYWCGDDTYYNSKGRSRLMQNRNLQQIQKFISDTLHCNYLLSTEYYNQHDTTWNRFVKTYCKPIFMDNGEFIVFKIEQTKGEYSLLKFKKLFQEKKQQGLTRFFITEKDVEKDN
jgi:hypothetical protein